MSKRYGWCLVLGLVVCPAAPAQPAGKVVRDLWDAAFLDGNQAGYIRTTTREIEQDGQKLLRSTLQLDLTLRRFRDTIQQKMESETTETADGKVVGVGMRQFLGKQQQLVLTGKVEGNQLHVQVTGKFQIDKRIPWNDKVVGLNRQHYLFREHQVKPESTFSYLAYEPLINAVIRTQVSVKDYEAVELLGSKRLLLRAEAVPDRIQDVQLPATTFWLDKDLQVVCSRFEMPGLGRLSLIRTTREVALTPPTASSDVGLSQLFRLNHRIPRAHDVAAVVYRITLPGEKEPASTFARDDRQEVKNARGQSFELHVKAIREPRPEEAGPTDEAYLKSNYFVNSSDGRVREFAREAVGNETDSWKKAQRIESWVHRKMKAVNFTEAMATADHVARTLEGDCTEFAMLTAAMCRAAGVPSRTAVGLVYADMPREGPVLAYHMWTEVGIRGQWIPIDATLARGSVGAAHIKIADHSWHDTQSLTPLLPVMRVMLGKPTIEVLRVGNAD